MTDSSTVTGSSRERRFINQLREHEDVDEVFLVQERQLRPNRNGNLYLQLRLADRTGAVTGMMWNASERVYGQISGGGYLRVRGKTQFYNGNLQILVQQVDSVPEDQVCAEEFTAFSQAQIQGYLEQLRTRSETLRAPLRELMETFLDHPPFIEPFCQAPAGIKNHHAYEGGLLEHVCKLMDVADSVCQHYEALDRDLLLVGVFLHDMGKVQELHWQGELGYSDAGQLVGHPVLGVVLLHEALERYAQTQAEPFPQELAAQLQHMIVSHHGRLEYGSPKVPMTLEALVLSCLDEMDAKLHQFIDIMSADVNSDSRWTIYHPHLGRKLFKASTHESNT